APGPGPLGQGTRPGRTRAAEANLMGTCSETQTKMGEWIESSRTRFVAIAVPRGSSGLRGSTLVFGYAVRYENCCSSGGERAGRWRSASVNSWPRCHIPGEHFVACGPDRSLGLGDVSPDGGDTRHRVRAEISGMKRREGAVALRTR